MPRKAPAVRTLGQARAFVLRAGICGIFSDDRGRMPSLWNVVDLPGRQPGEKGWGRKVVAIWTWKNELPAIYPGEIFYGKLPGGLAVLMSIEHLRRHHYPAHHKPIRECGALAREIHSLVRNDPLTTTEVRTALDMNHRPARNRVDRALQELQTTLNIVRRNSLEDERDTWVPFTEQYLEVARAHTSD